MVVSKSNNQAQVKQHEQDFSFSDRAIGFEPGSLADNSSDRKNEIGDAKNGRTDQMEMGVQGSESGILGSMSLGGIPSAEIFDVDDSDSDRIKESARLVSPANQASFDVGKLPIVTCGKIEPSNSQERIKWAIDNYTVDPIQNSKNRWRIRLRCRKTGCKHEGHLGLKTVSFMSDSAFQKVSRGSKKYADWKKQIKAENAGALRKSD
jgi:hypothetical protein